MSSQDVKLREGAANIFINYRREDSAGHSGRLFDGLNHHFAGRLLLRRGPTPTPARQAPWCWLPRRSDEENIANRFHIEGPDKVVAPSRPTRFAAIPICFSTCCQRRAGINRTSTARRRRFCRRRS